ncbi:hypothetical protein PCE1_004321 [Barthelona sp. PCE]
MTESKAFGYVNNLQKRIENLEKKLLKIESNSSKPRSQLNADQIQQIDDKPSIESNKALMERLFVKAKTFAIAAQEQMDLCIKEEREIAAAQVEEAIENTHNEEAEDFLTFAQMITFVRFLESNPDLIGLLEREREIWGMHGREVPDVTPLYDLSLLLGLLDGGTEEIAKCYSELIAFAKNNNELIIYVETSSIVTEGVLPDEPEPEPEPEPESRVKFGTIQGEMTLPEITFGFN